MINEHTMELINADIDGELASADKAELEGILESSAEARAFKAELIKLNNLMSDLPEQTPPADLSDQILGNIRLPSQKSSFSLSGLFAAFQPATAGVAFAAGLLLAIGFYEVSSGRIGSDDPTSMVGSMLASQDNSPALLKNDMILNGDGFFGTISLRESGGIYILNFDLESELMTEVEVGLDETGFAFGGFAEVQGETDSLLESVTMSGGALRVVNQGHQQFAVFLRESDAGVPVQLESMTISFSNSARL